MEEKPLYPAEISRSITGYKISIQNFKCLSHKIAHSETMGNLRLCTFKYFQIKKQTNKQTHLVLGRGGKYILECGWWYCRAILHHDLNWNDVSIFLTLQTPLRKTVVEEKQKGIIWIKIWAGILMPRWSISTPALNALPHGAVQWETGSDPMEKTETLKQATNNRLKPNINSMLDTYGLQRVVMNMHISRQGLQTGVNWAMMKMIKCLQKWLTRGTECEENKEVSTFIKHETGIGGCLIRRNKSLGQH